MEQFVTYALAFAIFGTLQIVLLVLLAAFWKKQLGKKIVLALSAGCFLINSFLIYQALTAEITVDEPQEKTQTK